MKVTCVIPVYNYIEGLYRITDWIRKEFITIFEDFEIIVFNDKSDDIYNKDFEKLSKKPKITVINSKVNTKNLKIPLEIAAKNAIRKNHDIVLITESDAIPNIDTFKHMLNVYMNPYRTPVASVSPMYKWNNKYCYPTSKHWFKDGLNSKLGRKTYINEGIVSTVGSAGVPFLFSIWNPIILQEINKLEFPNMVGLDGKFGEYAHNKGYHHLRLLNHNIGHYDGGQKSWKKPNQTINEISIKPNQIINNKRSINPRNNSFKKQQNLIKKPEYYISNSPVLEKLKINKKIAVLIHLYYIDLWSEFEVYLSTLNYEFDIYINIVESSTSINTLMNFKKDLILKYPNAIVLLSDNKGMDIGGTFNLLEYIFKLDKKYDLFLKIHSKKSLHSASENIGNSWRKELIQPLVQNSVIRIFDDIDIGMVGSKKWHIKTKMNKRLTFMSNLLFIREYHKYLNLTLSENDIEFIGGTMFWIRADILYKYFNIDKLIKIRNLFEYGKFTDHRNPSRTHAFERIFGSLVINDKKKIFGI